MVDSSALIALFTADADALDRALTQRLSSAIPHVPDVVDVEFHHALRGLLLGKKISVERAEHARSLFAAMPLIRFPSRDLMERVWSLRWNVGAYDACFIALAEGLDVPLLTCDEKQATASGHQADVEAYAP